MLASLLLSAAAGALVSRADPYVGRAVIRILELKRPLDPSGLRLLTFGLLVLLAGVLTALLRADSSVIAAMIGGLLGYFWQSIYGFFRDPDRALGRDADDWDGSLERKPTEAADSREPPVKTDIPVKTDAPVKTDVKTDDDTLQAVRNAVAPTSEESQR